MIPEVSNDVTVVTPKVVIPVALRFLEMSTSVVAMDTGVGADTVTLPVDVLIDTFVLAGDDRYNTNGQRWNHHQ